MEKYKTIKKKVLPDFDKVYHRQLKQVLMDALLNIIQSINNESGFFTENSDISLEKQLSILIKYEDLIKYQPVNNMLQKLLNYSYHGQKKNLSDSDRKVLFRAVIWTQFEEILEDESYNMLDNVVELEITISDPFNCGQICMSYVVSVSMNKQAVDNWFEIQSMPITKMSLLPF